MQLDIVQFPHRKAIIAPSSWPKKQLADVHVEALLLCQYKCRYCSSNSGRHLKTIRHEIEEAVHQVTGSSFDPHRADNLAISFDDVVQALESQLSQNCRKPGEGKTLVYSQLTDGFSPIVLRNGTTRRILELLVEKTKYRIRILTKNPIVGTSNWINFFASHPERFVVGLSIGTLNDKLGRRLEKGTPRPSSRISAMCALQDAGVPTFGMLCPMFPQVLQGDELEQLIKAIRPVRCENVWAEPYNNRQNWQHARECFEPQSYVWNWMSQVYGDADKALWSRYATDLYTRIRDTARHDAWIDRLRYLLYEDQITSADADQFSGLEGVLLQSKDTGQGISRNPRFAQLQLNRAEISSI